MYYFDDSLDTFRSTSQISDRLTKTRLLSRVYSYTEWIKILGPDGNDNETKVLCEFAKKHYVRGYILDTLSPDMVGPTVRFTRPVRISTPINDSVAKNIVPCTKQLKLCECNPKLIIGISMYTLSGAMKDQTIYNFEELNDVVDFYEIKTNQLNTICNPNLYNGLTPITKTDTKDPNYLYSMEEVASHLIETKICRTKIIYDIDIYPINIKSKTYSSYSQVCKGKFKNSSWCVQTSKDFYNKGKFAHDQKSGINVVILDLDDINNDCECNTTFNGFKNIIAGFTAMVVNMHQVQSLTFNHITIQLNN
ncbi:Uncharacterized protein FWK35_00021972 [Aphis craccivora]|uniref:Uncharacterized protein n=1 Tax=Aphis craccivora TaxID=307492 RepID=A0A6G0Y6H9_APHCR|nr:Uncharacterized protein FWK35_00021972 [Aphis craccivora]